MPSLPPLVDPVPALSDAEAARTARQSLLPELGELGQRRLAAASVLVVGAGGLGAPVLQYLAAAGVGSIGIIDDDVVEASNLHRQVIHGHDDLGGPKAQNARRRVLALNPGAQVQVHQVRLSEENAEEVLAGHDLVLDGTDTFATRYLVADTCAALGIPLVWGSVLRFDAQVSVFWSAPPAPAGAVTMRDLFPQPPAPGTVPSCAEAGVIGSLCGIAGSIMATEAVKLITGIGQVLLGRVAVIDALSMRIHEVPLQPGETEASRDADTADGESAAPTVGSGNDRAEPEGLPLGPIPTTTPVTVLDLPGYRRRERSNGAPGAGETVLLDVREPAEAAADRLSGAVNIPVGEFLQAARTADPSAGLQELLGAAGITGKADLITYCSAGVRATRATRILDQAGWSSAVLEPEAVQTMRSEQMEQA